jgi:hypothetical protein
MGTKTLMIMKNIVILVIFLISIIGCNNNDFSRCYYFSTDLNLEYEHFTHQLIDSEFVYIFGSLEKEKLNYRTREITIERSAVSDMQKWSDFAENIPGECKAVYQKNNNIFLIAKQQFQHPQNFKYTKHKLYKITKKEGKISELYEWDIENAFVRDIYYTNDGRLIVLFCPFRKPLDYQIYISKDDGVSWNVYNINRPIIKSQLHKDKIYFLSYKRNIRNWIFSFDINEHNLDSIRFDLVIKDFVVDKKENFWLLQKNDSITLLQHYCRDTIHKVHTFSKKNDFFGTELYMHNDLIVMQGGEIDRSMLGGFGGTHPKLFISLDEGRNWSKAPTKSAFYLNPVSFYKDEFMLSYTGFGKMLKCDFKNTE